MYKITTTNRFEKEVKICIKRGYDISLLKNVMEMLAENGTLPIKYKPHKLSGNYNNCWECHIKPDWLLIWQQNDTELVLLFMNTGSHSDLF
jgi:mRNA interferase YafQ